MKRAVIAVFALALTSSVAYAHPHKGWGCHAHKEDMSSSEVFTHIHCGPE